MKNSPLDRELRSRIDAFVNELTNLVKLSALEAVHEALGSTLNAGVAGGAAPAAAPTAGKRGPGRPPKAARGKGGKRSPEDVLKTAATVLSHIKANPGQRLEQIGKAVKMPTKDLKLPIQKLFEQKVINTKGEKRGTKYFAR